MTQQEKENIALALRSYVDRYPSQNKAAASLKGISAGTLSVILSGDFTSISDNMFRSIMEQITPGAGRGGWQIVETGAFQEIQAALADAQQYRNVRWIVGDAGCGKTTAAEIYARENREVFVILCDEDMRKSDFIREISRKVGLRSAGMRIREMLESCIAQISRMEAPLLIFDEGDKLNDNVFHYFINIYNHLEGKCGIVFMSTSYIEQRIERGVNANRKGYNEIYSRIGRKFFGLDPTTEIDVSAICRANGVSDRRSVARILDTTRKSGYDLRCVKGAVHREKRVRAANAEGEAEERSKAV